MIEMKINRDNSEIVPYDTFGVPLFIKEGYMSLYPDNRVLCHWHEDIEFTYVVSGKINCFVNGSKIIVHAGEALMVNSSQMHHGFSDKTEDCYFYCIMIHPSLLTTNKVLYQKYIEPVITNKNFAYHIFSSDNPASHLLKEIYETKYRVFPVYELEVLSLFHSLWNMIYKVHTDLHKDSMEIHNDDLQIQRQMISYIYQNYSSNLNLNDIAATGKVCRSKCCKIFQKYLGQTPIDFLNSYRLECSQHLLLTTDLSITEICTSCGFNHMSYFSKQFQIKYGETPRNYRKIYKK